MAILELILEIKTCFVFKVVRVYKALRYLLAVASCLNWTQVLLCVLSTQTLFIEMIDH